MTAPASLLIADCDACGFMFPTLTPVSLCLECRGVRRPRNAPPRLLVHRLCLLACDLRLAQVQALAALRMGCPRLAEAVLERVAVDPRPATDIYNRPRKDVA